MYLKPENIVCNLKETLFLSCEQFTAISAHICITELKFAFFNLFIILNKFLIYRI